METKSAYIIAGSIIIAGCIIAFSVHQPGPPPIPPTPPVRVATLPGLPSPTATAAHATEKSPAQKLVGKWQEIATWGSLQLSADGSAVFSSPPNSIKCRWSLVEDGKLRTETDAPKTDAPGIYGDPSKVRTWNYKLVGTDQLTLTYRSGDGSAGEEEKLSYMRVTADKDKK